MSENLLSVRFESSPTVKHNITFSVFFSWFYNHQHHHHHYHNNNNKLVSHRYQYNIFSCALQYNNIFNYPLQCLRKYNYL